MKAVDLPVQLVKLQPAETLSATWRPSWLARWHLLSLDAPTVAVTWTCFVAHAAHVRLPPAVPAAMFLAVWIVYAADRLLDGISSTDISEARHRFHHRHRRQFIATLIAAATLLIPLTLAIPLPDLKQYLGLAALFLLWFGAVHLHNSRLPKELLPGFFCAAAAFIPVWQTAGFRHFALPALLYCVLITLNCWCIYSWEHDDSTNAHISTRLGLRWLKEFHIATVLTSLGALPFVEPALAPIFLAIALSAMLLIGLNHLRPRLDPTTLRAAADLVLLTPLLFMASLR